MKTSFALIALFLPITVASRAADLPATSSGKPAIPSEFAPITDDPKLPRVLLIGDSVSIAYTLAVRQELAGIANVHRVPANGGSTKTALGSYGLVNWLADANAKWDVIHFNHGLHDLSYRFADDSDRDKDGNYATPTNGGHQNVPPTEYEKNLRQIIARLNRTGAKLIFASTTPVPESDAAKYVNESELPYNEIAKKVMVEEGVAWNDLWALVKPDQEKLQIKRNVHFRPAGSTVMAKQVAQTWKADTDWHDLILVAAGDEMRLTIDGKLVASHRSAGFAHPVKRWFSFGIPGKVWIDDVKIWKVK